MALTRLVALLALAAAAAGCEVNSQSAGGGGLREAVGLSAPPPDEFLIVARAPLQTPPDLRALPPPRLGEPSRVERDPTADARAALAGAGSSGVAAAPSQGEQALLAATGGAGADPAIRQQIVAEGEGPRRFGLTSLFGVPIPQTPPGQPSDRLDPAQESDRLRDQGLTAPVPPPPATN